MSLFRDRAYDITEASLCVCCVAQADLDGAAKIWGTGCPVYGQFPPLSLVIPGPGQASFDSQGTLYMSDRGASCGRRDTSMGC